MEKATDEGEPIFVPTICLVEATYPAEKSRIEADALAHRGKAIGEPDSAFQPVSLTVEIAFALREIPRSSVPDLPDRVIGATALSLGLPLITRDRKVQASGIETIW